jgi:aminoglycoside phosphotransferase family enzyme
VRSAQVLETHISWVLLAGQLAYKVKKPVRLPFVDYSTLERRHFLCEEVRLNLRLAAPLYLGVSRITGPAEHPSIDGDGPALEYAVRMRRFAQECLFSEQLTARTLAADGVDRFAKLLAQFHAAAPRAGPDGPSAVDRQPPNRWQGKNRPS